MKPAKEQAEEMIEMMFCNVNDRHLSKQCAAITCQYIINNSPHSSEGRVHYSTTNYWKEVLNQVIISKYE